jgi:hypothetical protein
MADTVPVVTFGSIADVCVGSGSVTLNTGMPSGGMYMGNNVSGSAYNPSMVGTDTLTYVFVDSNSCSDTITQTITVNALPTVALGNLTDVCENTPAFALSGGTPAGGMYSGNNVSGGSFDPGAAGTGSTTITYTYTDGNSCTDSAQNTIMVNTVTAAVFNYIGHSCNNHDPINLATYASPAGGTFSGGSVSGNNFDPSAAGTGVHTVSYTFTNSNNCSDSASRTITVEAAPVFTMVGVKTNGCNNDPAVITTSLSGSSGYTYHWKDGSKGDTAYVRQNGDVWVQVTDGSTIRLCASTDTIKGITYEEICVGLDEALSGTSINYFPNPSNGNFSYQLEGFDGLDVEVTIVNANGQVVYNTTWTEVSNFHTGEINLTDVESGLYFINLSTEKGNVMHRITVTK